MSLTDAPRLLGAQVDLRLIPGAAAAMEARRALDRLDDLLPPSRLDDLRLVVSELVTNSVRHAGLSSEERISLSVEVLSGSVRGRVCDPGPGFEKPPSRGRGPT